MFDHFHYNLRDNTTFDLLAGWDHASLGTIILSVCSIDDKLLDNPFLDNRYTQTLSSWL